MSLINNFDESTILNVWVDGSYVLYSSIHATVKKWSNESVNSNILKKATETDQDNLPDLTIYSDFQKKLEDVFTTKVSSIFDIIKNNREDIGFTTHERYYFVLDSVRESNWRYDYFSEYKMNRKVVPKQFQVGKAFDYITSIIMPKIDFSTYFNITPLIYQSVEADDIIGVSCMYTHKNEKNVIIASDKDYKQLEDLGVLQFNLENKPVKIKAEDYGLESMSAKQYLLAKLIHGDKGDNITSIAIRHGPKTAGKYIKDPDKLKTLLNEDANALRQFKLNRKLIDFNQIPKTKKQEIIKYVKSQIK